MKEHRCNERRHGRKVSEESGIETERASNSVGNNKVRMPGDKEMEPVLSPGTLRFTRSPSTCKRDLLIRFPCLVRPDPNGDFSVQPLEKIQQFVSCEAAVMSVHQMRYV